MATKILCDNAEFTNDSKSRLGCKTTQDHCLHQMYCPLAEHATNRGTAEECKNFKSIKE